MGIDHGAAPGLSIIIPSYNSARWLPSTLEALKLALSHTSWTAEVIVVDDGSTDGSGALLRSIAATYAYPLTVIQQPNRGRFLARWAGLEAATSASVLLLDSRVLLGEHALAHVEETQRSDPSQSVWNGHAITDPSAPLVGHFWQVPVYLFWGRFLAHPAPTHITIDNYNRLPKGTGVFIAPRQMLIDACKASWPSRAATLTSDDTKVLRHIAGAVPIRLDPGFVATYRPRTTVQGFIKHSFGRGTFLVDSFGGTSWTWNFLIVLGAVIPAVLLLAVVLLLASGLVTTAAVLCGIGLIGLLLPAAAAALRRCPAKGVLSYLTYALVFLGPYWAGLVRGIAVHGRKLCGVKASGATRTVES